MVAARASSTPCHSGESAANGRSPPGSWLIGKKVPENKNSGSTPSRMIIGNERSESWVIENAASGAQNAAAHKPAAGIARTPHADGTAPSSAATRRNAAAPSMERSAVQSTNPPYSSPGPIGVATTPWNWRIHFTPPSTGHIDSAGRELHRARDEQPGRDEVEIGEAVDRSRCARSTRPPRPMPIAARYRAGWTNVLNARPRQSRRYTSASRSTTRNSGGVDTAGSQSSSVRPVRIKNTSSRLARRTSTDAGSKPSLDDRARGGVAVVGVDENAVGEGLDPISEPLEPGDLRRGIGVDVEADLDHLSGDVVGDQLPGRALGDDARVVHDHEAVAELLGLVHVVRREHERHAGALEPVEPVPEQMSSLRIEPRRRLVEQQAPPAG